MTHWGWDDTDDDFYIETQSAESDYEDDYSPANTTDSEYTSGISDIEEFEYVDDSSEESKKDAKSVLPSKGVQAEAIQRTYSNLSGFSFPSLQMGEWKVMDVSVLGAVSTTPVLLLMNGIQNGTAYYNRVGTVISIRSVELRINFISTAGTGVDQLQRYSLVLDRQPNGLAPLFTDIYGMIGGASGLSSMRNLQNRKRFKVLWDRTYNVNVNTGSNYNKYLYLKFRRPIKTTYNAGNSGNVSDISSNALYFVSIGTQAAGATAGAVQGYTRIRFVDS